MSVLTDEESAYLRRRRSLVRRWPVVGGVLIAAIVAVVLLLYRRTPLLVNPWETAALLQAERVPPLTVAQMAAKLPIVFLVCCGLLMALVLFQFAAGATERRLLRLIDGVVDRAQRAGTGDEGPDDVAPD